MKSAPATVPPSRREWYRIPAALAAPWRRCFEEFLSALERCTAGRSLPVGLARVLGWTLLFWWIYVPVHELLHALGCVAGGGEASRLWIQARYGGALLARIFPFVSAGGAYAGRLEGFDTHGSDLDYLLTVLLPYLLTLLGAFPLLKLASRRRSAGLLGLATVLAAAPLVALPGDLYEAGSILVSAAIQPFWPPGSVPSPASLRHDDLLALARLFPARFPTHRGGWAAGVLLSGFSGFAIGSLLYWASHRIARWTKGPLLLAEGDRSTSRDSNSYR